MNSNKLKAKLVECGETQRSLADALDIDVATINKKVNGKALFNANEIKKIIELLKLSGDEVISIFFAEELAYS